MNYRIQMKVQGNWVTLGGVYDPSEADARIQQFMNCFMQRSEPKNPSSSLICAREFRTQRE